MGDLVSFMEISDEKGEVSSDIGFSPVSLAIAVASILAIGLKISDVDLGDIVGTVQAFLDDPATTMLGVTESVKTMGPMGVFYFGFMYTIAEVLAIPAVPLTASAGYLFGVSTGFLVVLISANIAASISFLIGRTLLRSTVQEMLKDYPDFQKIDRGIQKEGFKLMMLLRLSPVFPFALSNYLYGASSISFNAYFWGTLFGFAPGTLAYVYTGVVGKALTIGGDGTQPWYVYAGGGLLLAGFLKIFADVATGIVEQIEEDEQL